MLTSLQHNFDFRMDHNSDTGTNTIGSIINSDKVVCRWQEREMHYIINDNKPWIPCTCEADTPNVNLHSNIQRTEWQTKPDLAAAPSTVLDNPVAAVAALIKIPAAGPSAAAAAVMIKTPASLAIGLTSTKMADDDTNPGAILAVTRPRKASWRVIAITMTMNRNAHVEEPTY